MTFLMWSNVPPLLFSVSVNSVLYPGSLTEFMGFLLSFKRGSFFQWSRSSVCVRWKMLKILHGGMEGKRCLTERMLSVC